MKGNSVGFCMFFGSHHIRLELGCCLFVCGQTSYMLNSKVFSFSVVSRTLQLRFYIYSNHDFTCYHLCDLEPVTVIPCASVSSPINWEK